MSKINILHKRNATALAYTKSIQTRIKRRISSKNIELIGVHLHPFDTPQKFQVKIKPYIQNPLKSETTEHHKPSKFHRHSNFKKKKKKQLKQKKKKKKKPNKTHSKK